MIKTAGVGVIHEVKCQHQVLKAGMIVTVRDDFTGIGMQIHFGVYIIIKGDFPQWILLPAIEFKRRKG